MEQTPFCKLVLSLNTTLGEHLQSQKYFFLNEKRSKISKNLAFHAISDCNKGPCNCTDDVNLLTFGIIRLLEKNFLKKWCTFAECSNESQNENNFGSLLHLASEFGLEIVVMRQVERLSHQVI